MTSGHFARTGGYNSVAASTNIRGNFSKNVLVMSLENDWLVWWVSFADKGHWDCYCDSPTPCLNFLVFYYFHVFFKDKLLRYLFPFMSRGGDLSQRNNWTITATPIVVGASFFIKKKCGAWCLFAKGARVEQVLQICFADAYEIAINVQKRINDINPCGFYWVKFCGKYFS